MAFFVKRLITMNQSDGSPTRLFLSWRRIGAWGILLFLIKGISWVIVPALIAGGMGSRTASEPSRKPNQPESHADTDPI